MRPPWPLPKLLEQDMSGNAARTAAIAAVAGYSSSMPTISGETAPSELFGANVFSRSEMQSRLPKSVYKSVVATIDKGEKLDPSIADAVAAVVAGAAVAALAAGEVDRVVAAPARRKQRVDLGQQVLRKLDEFEDLAPADRVGGDHTPTSGCGHHDDPVSRRERLGRQRRCGLERLLDGGCPADTRLPARAVEHPVVGRERTGVARRSAGPAGRGAALDEHHRFGRRDRSHGVEERQIEQVDAAALQVGARIPRLLDDAVHDTLRVGEHHEVALDRLEVRLALAGEHAAEAAGAEALDQARSDEADDALVPVFRADQDHRQIGIDVYQAVGRNNANAGGGVLPQYAEQYLIRGVGLVRDLEDLRAIVLKEKDGVPVYVRDVAEVEIGHEVRQGAVIKNGTTEAVGGVVMMIAGGNAKEVVGRIKARVDELLRLVQLERLGDRYPSQLSGGQRQRVALARALAIEPSVLLLDEPFGALDAFTREELWCMTRDIHQSRGVTAMLVTHDLREAVFLADTVYVMSDRPGKIVKVQTIDLPRPRDLEITYEKPFQDLVHELRSHIGKH